MLRILRIGSRNTAVSLSRLSFVVDNFSSEIKKFNYDVVLIAGYCETDIDNSSLRTVVHRVKQENPDVWICYDGGEEVKDDINIQWSLMNIAASASLVVVSHHIAESVIGKNITCISEVVDAAGTLLSFGAPFCAIRDLQIHPSNDKISHILATRDKVFRVDTDRALYPRPKDGVYEVAMSTMMGLLLHKHRENPAVALEMCSTALQEIYTSHRGNTLPTSLPLESHLSAGLNRGYTYDWTAQKKKLGGYICTGKVQGVIFDMDGTLTEPGAIDFLAMYTRIGMTKQVGLDILQQIENEFAGDPVGKERALQIIFEEEMKGCANMVVRSDMLDVVSRLGRQRLRLAVSTRNCEQAFEKFLEMCGLHEETFEPALSRESLGKINKPDPQVAVHILQRWEIIDPTTVWFVGDSMDDILCGKGAGCRTCLVGPNTSFDKFEDHKHMIDMRVETLSEFYDELSPHLPQHSV